VRNASVALGLIVLPLLGCDGNGGGSSMMPPPPPPPASAIEVTRVYPALAFTNPVLAAQAPGDDARWFVVEQAGRVLVFDNLDTVAATSVFIDITAREVVDARPFYTGILLGGVLQDDTDRLFRERKRG